MFLQTCFCLAFLLIVLLSAIKLKIISLCHIWIMLYVITHIILSFFWIKKVYYNNKIPSIKPPYLWHLQASYRHVWVRVHSLGLEPTPLEGLSYRWSGQWALRTRIKGEIVCIVCIVSTIAFHLYWMLVSFRILTAKNQLKHKVWI